MRGRERTLVKGWGVNDADYPVNWSVNGERFRCPIFSIWKSLICRTIPPIKESHASYADCSISDGWKHYMDFYNWTNNRDWEGLRLDKDVLIRGNRIYSPDTCVYIPNSLNQLLKQPKKSDSDICMGVRYLHGYKDSKDKFEAYSKYEQKYIYLGTYYSKEEAHAAWQQEKVTHFEKEIQKLEEMNFKDQRIYPALENLISKLQFDLENNLETISL